MWPLRMFTRITLYKCIWNRRLLAGSLCNSRTEESQAINKKIRSRRSALPKQRNDLLCGSFPVANYRSTKGYSKYRNYLWYSSETGVVLLFRQKKQIRMMFFSLRHFCLSSNQLQMPLLLLLLLFASRNVCMYVYLSNWRYATEIQRFVFLDSVSVFMITVQCTKQQWHLLVWSSCFIQS